jgi:hypothetical protein
MARRIDQGESRDSAARLFARRHSGRRYKTDPARSFKISRSSLNELFPRWEGSPNPSVFRLRYKPGRKPIPARTRIAFMRECLQPGVGRFGQAYTRMARAWRQQHQGKRFPWRPGSLQKSLTAAERIELRRLFAVRQEALRAETRIVARFRAYCQRPANGRRAFRGCDGSGQGAPIVLQEGSGVLQDSPESQVKR